MLGCLMMMNFRLASALLAVLLPALAAAQSAGDWIPLFNGRDLTGWTPKITGYELGDNFANTFSVRDGVLRVSYEGYDAFKERFGHIFYKDKFSHYRLVVDYRFTGDQAPGGPAWATRNSGAMLHSQSPESMGKDQNFPASIEVQFLGGLGKGPRTTSNVCTPGTNVVMNGELVTRHCTTSTSPTFDGDQWVRAEVIVLGGDRFEHIIDGKTVLRYEKPQYGGGNVSGLKQPLPPEGTPITEGYIALQSESHPVEFRKVELLNLKGCMDPKSPKFRKRFVAPDPASCR
jgi:hypothetical protein